MFQLNSFRLIGQFKKLYTFIYVRAASGDRAVVNGAESVSALTGFHPSRETLSCFSDHGYAPRW
jgi:hypothetical protein